MYFQINWRGKRVFGVGKRSDGGEKSGVTAYIIESKYLASIALLRFSNGTREAYHSHAFNALTLWFKGRVVEERLYPGIEQEDTEYRAGQWKITRRDNMHRVRSIGTSWALTLRGPWADVWQEFRNGKTVHLTHGRKEVHGV